jgi:uncharacterized membrane protein
MFNDSLTLTTDPAYPWSLSYGGAGLLLVALVLGGLTLWTYLGASLASARRTFIVLCLRFLALLLAILAVLRPSFASRDDLKTPSVLIILADASESMSITDEYSNLSRWNAQRLILEKCQPALQQLRDEQNVTVYLKMFAEDVRDFDPNRAPDGKRTDTGSALNQLFQEHGQERYLRGLLLLSDGADNGARFLATGEAERWRRRSCPVHTFSLGQTTTSSKQQDINLVSISPSPSPVPVKNKLTVSVVIDAPGYENALVPVRLFIDDKEVKEATVEERLTRAAGNEVKLSVNAPDKPGEIKVTVKVEPQFGEVVRGNNEISTFVTVAKEGLSVLYVEGKIRAWEPTFIRRALTDPRIRLDQMVRLSDEPLSPAEAAVLRFDKQHYDVIILGDISARRLSGGDPAVLTRIRDQVVNHGTGLMMLGGRDTFGNSDWKTFGKPLADILPVDLNESDQLETAIRMVPTRQGIDQFVMRLAADPKKNQALWEREDLPRFTGLTRMGRPKLQAIVLARANDALTGAPLLVSQEVGSGRVLVFAGDETWKWVNLGAPKSRDGVAMHGQFWKQIALWLAKQEEATGNVWIKPDARRIPAGDKLGFTLGLRGKSGLDLHDAEFNVKVIGPNKVEHGLTTNREAAGQRGVFVRTELAGEYKIVVRARGKDADGQDISGEASSRFLVYQDTAEMARQAADHEFLARLANAGGGKAMRAEDLPAFLADLRNQPLPQRGQKVELWPDWRSNRLSGFMVLFFLLFVAVLSIEWVLRRRWGLV